MYRTYNPGSGKSTLLRTMNGLVPHFYGGDLDGEVFAGCDVATTQLHDIGRYSSSIFQNPRTQFFTSHVNTELAFLPRELWRVAGGD